MPVSVTMPRLGESVTEGTVTRWLKKEGDQVTADEPLLEVSTDKVDTEIPSPASGVLQSIKVGEDETVEVGAELAIIADAGAPAEAAQPPAAAAAPAPEPQAAQTAVPVQPKSEVPAPEAPIPATGTPVAEAPVAAAPVAAAPVAAAPVAAAPVAATPVPQQAATKDSADTGPDDPADGDGGPAYVTPLVRRLAAEQGVDLAAVHGTGLGGRVRKQDVLDAAQGAAPSAQAQAAPAPAASAKEATAAAVTQPLVTSAPAPARTAPKAATAALKGHTQKLSRLRQVIAARMVESLQVSAQLTTVVEVDVTKIARLRQQAKSAFEGREGVKLSFLPFFAVAAIEALKLHPVVNSSIDLDAGTVSYHDGVHLGIAVDTDRGLLVPVIADAGDLNLAGVARKIADLAERTRSNQVSPDELGGGTFTLTNTGSRGALFDTPIINQPQVAILGTGAVVKRPVVVNDPGVGEVTAVRSMVYLALSYDHRIVDGADAARFLVTMKERLEEGRFESELGLA